MTKEKIILPESNEAAQLKTVTGWVSRHGRFWGDYEEEARSEGATHKKCTKGHLYKANSYCEECRIEAEKAKYQAAERIAYTGGVVYSQTLDRFYFDDEDGIFDDAKHHGLTLDEMRLFDTVEENAMVKEIDFESIVPELPDDSDYYDVIPTNVMEKINELNKLLEKSHSPIYYPGKNVVCFKNSQKLDAPILSTRKL